MTIKAGEILSTINSPTELRRLNTKALTDLCAELREFIIEAVSHNPGHFGASLGVVELAVALHYVFNTPDDKLVWDVGHQAYAHKILTGRRDTFFTNRTYKGISGFPKMSESIYDSFGVGHSSTSISAALGMAISSRLEGNKTRQHIAVIGDGALTGGMSFEALNHAGATNANLLVILNDNGIAIDKNVGALKDYLTNITTSERYNKIKDDIWNMLGGLGKYGPNARKTIQKIENAIKLTIFRNSNYFESLKFRYFGPVDGHDLPKLVKILSDLKKIQGPKILHIITVKGKGFEIAEKEQTKYHAPGFFDKDTGEIIETIDPENHSPKYQKVFGETLVELAKINPKIVGITPAMASGCSMDIMMKHFPDRTFDVGIAEQHAVTFAAGMAAQGSIPFCNIYSTFSQRGYDQIIHDVALQKHNVVFCFDRGGLVGEDGPTHHGAFDIAALRCIPDIIISSPLNEKELRNLMFTAQNKANGAFVIRYPRGYGVMVDWQTPFEEIEIGKGVKISDGENTAILTFGPVGNNVIEAKKILALDNINPAHFDIRFAKPLDEELLHDIFSKYKNIITIEDGTVIGGFGTAVSEFQITHKYKSEITKLGIPDRFIEHGSIKDLHRECGFDTESIVNVVKSLQTVSKTY